MPTICAVAVLSLLPRMGGAAPLDARLTIEGKQPRIERLDPSFTAAESEDESIVHAEILPSGELLLDPKNPGVTRVFIYADRLVRVVEVAANAALPAIEPAPAAPCAKTRIAPPCYLAWRAHLLHQTAAETPQLELELETVQSELLAAQTALDKAGLASVVLRSSPFGLKLKGAKDPAEERRALRIAWPWLLGPLRLDR